MGDSSLTSIGIIMKKLKQSAQSLTELALCLAVVGSAFLGFQLYMQRGVMAKHKEAVKYLFSAIEKEATEAGFGELADSASLQQYDPYYWESNITVASGEYVSGRDKPNVGEKLENGEQTMDNIVNRSGWQKVGSTENAD